MAEEAKMKGSPTRWWFDSYNHKDTVSPKRSPWLQSTLSELDEKTNAMLNIIEGDADSFAQRAEMYYKKRPELISMVEDFYRAQRSLVERYDQVKPDAGFRLLTPWASPSPLSSKYQKQKMSAMACTEISYDSYSETYDPVESEESEVDDPEQEEGEEEKEEEEEEEEVSSEFVNGEVMKLREEIERLKEDNKIQKEEIAQKDGEKREEVSSEFVNGEVMRLREEIERLKEENKIQKEEIAEKDEEKREVIRQLSLAMDVLREENVKLKKCIAKKWSPHSDFHKFMGKLFNGSLK